MNLRKGVSVVFDVLCICILIWKENCYMFIIVIAMNYPNIRLQTIMADSVVLETPVASLWYGNKMERSRYGLSHTRYNFYK